jgi:hypothetical protein
LAFAALLALCVWADGLARSGGYESILAPSRDDLWLGIQLGAALGAFPVIPAAVYRVVRRVAPHPEQTGWRWVLYTNFVCFLLLLSGTLVWRFLRLKVGLILPLCSLCVVNYPIAQVFRAAFGTLPDED